MSSKAYLVHVRGRTEGESYLLADATREEFMGVPCIKGTYRPNKSTSHWMAGRQLHPLGQRLASYRVRFVRRVLRGAMSGITREVQVNGRTAVG